MKIEWTKIAIFSHNPKVDSSSLTSATTNLTRVARDCRLLFFVSDVILRKWGQLGDTSFYKAHKIA